MSISLLLAFVNISLLVGILFHFITLFSYVLNRTNWEDKMKEAGEMQFAFFWMFPVFCHLAVAIILSWQPYFGFSIGGVAILGLYIIDSLLFEIPYFTKLSSWARLTILPLIQVLITSALFLALS